MHTFVSKYATAAHLAILAVAPLLLLPFLGTFVTAVVVLWLSAFGFAWIVMEPSRHRGEMAHDARTRVGKAILLDPLFWFSLVCVIYAGIRALNGGIGMEYDAEEMVWSLREAAFPFLPGHAHESGFFPFAQVVALSVVLQGVRHALGRSARIAFLLTASTGSAIAGFTLAICISYGNAQALAWTQNSFRVASYFGTVFGLQVLCGISAVFGVIVNQWMRCEPIAAIALVGNAIGLVLVAPPLTIAVFACAALLLIIVSFIASHRQLAGSGSLRCFLAMVMAIGAAVMYMLATADMPVIAQKIAVFKTYKPFPDNFFALRDALSAISLKTWKANPWLGTGLDSFRIDLRFAATPEDWRVISPLQQTPLNGWWMLLVERGVIGASLFAVALGMLLRTYVSRIIGVFPRFPVASEHFVGLFGLLTLIGLAFFDCSYLRPEVIVLAGMLLAISGSAFPAHERKSRED